MVLNRSHPSNFEICTINPSFFGISTLEFFHMVTYYQALANGGGTHNKLNLVHFCLFL